MQSAVVRRWSSSRIRHLRGVDSGEKWIASHHLPHGWSHQIHSWPIAQSTISPWYGTSARAHRWRRAISRHDPQASAKATEQRIAPEVEPNPSDHVREPVTVPTTRKQAMDGESAEWSSAHYTAAEGEPIKHQGLLDLKRGLIDFETDWEIELPPLLSPSSPLVPSSPPSSLVPLCSPEKASDPPVPAPQKCPPSHPLRLLHHCRLAETSLALSPISVWCEPRGSAILQRHQGWSIPHLCLQPPRPGLRLGP